MARARALGTALVAAAALAGAARGTSAAPHSPWTHFDAAAGLAANRVQAIASAPGGALWVGTDRGLSRFDGASWRSWKAVDGLPDDDVKGVALDAAGLLWVAAGPGFGRFDGQRWNRLAAPGERPGGRVSVAATADGSVWLGHSSGLIRFNAAAGALEPFPALAGAEVRALLADRAGRLWVAVAYGLLLIEGERWSVLGERDGVPAGPMALAQGEEGTLWCVGERGLAYYDGVSWRPGELPRWLGGTITSVAVDGDGRLWIGTTAGAGYHDGYEWRWFDAAAGLPAAEVLALAADANGSIWVGTARGLARFDVSWSVPPAALREGPTPLAPLLPLPGGPVWSGAGRGLLALRDRMVEEVGAREGIEARVLAIAPAEGDEVWAGTDRGLVRVSGRGVEETILPKLETVWESFEDGRSTARKVPVCEPKEGLTGAEVRALAPDGEGGLWVGTATGLSHLRDGAWTCLEGEAGAPAGASIRALAAAGPGLLWAGTEDGLFELAAGAWRRHDRASGLPGAAVNALLVARDGTVWVGTERGLARGRGEGWTVIKAGEGLVGDRVLALFEDAGGRLWVGTADGVSFLEGGLWGSFGERDGLPSPRVTSFAEVDGRIWFASAEGVATHRPDRVPPETRIANPPAGPLAAAMHVFELAGSDLETPPAGLRYSWRLDGGSWSPWGAESRATLAGLANGRHSFEARSLDRELNADPTPALAEFEVNTSLFDVEVLEASFAPVHAALWQHYATDPDWERRPLGRLRLRSRYDRPLRVKASVWLPDLMDFPTDTVVTVPPGGEEVAVPLRLELGEGALALAETAARQARLTLQYAVAGERKEAELTVPVTVIEKSAMSWEEPERIGLYATHLDEAVERFARATVQAFAAEERAAIVYDTLIRAMALFDALGAAGLRYLPDPSNPYGGILAGRPTLDVVRLPRETLRQGAGDCDDLAVLYAALLENVGIDTALVDVRDHVFVMLDTGLARGGARQLGADPALVHVDARGRVWVPVETTLVGRSFTDAWRAGADTMAARPFTVIEMKEAWRRYQPLRPPGDAPEIVPPAAELVRPRLAEDLRRQEDALAGPQIRALRAREEADPADATAANALGVLLARRGYLGQAAARFERAVALAPAFAGAHGNLGNVRYEQGRHREAVASYEESLRLAETPEVHVELALAWCELGRFDLAREHYRRAMEMAPGIAAGAGSGAPAAVP